MSLEQKHFQILHILTNLLISINIIYFQENTGYNFKTLLLFIK